MPTKKTIEMINLYKNGRTLTQISEIFKIEKQEIAKRIHNAEQETERTKKTYYNKKNRDEDVKWLKEIRKQEKNQDRTLMHSALTWNN